MKKLLLAVALISILALGCSQSSQQSYKNITAKELKTLLDSKKDVFLIDVHTPEQKHLKGTDAVIPYEHIQHYTSALPADKNAKIVVYCRGGGMGTTAAQSLMDLGYTDVSNLIMGVQGWKDAGYPY